MDDMPRWMMADPAKVYERIEEAEQAKAARSPQAKQDRAKEKLKSLFKEPPRDTDNK